MADQQKQNKPDDLAGDKFFNETTLLRNSQAGRKAASEEAKSSEREGQLFGLLDEKLE